MIQDMSKYIYNEHFFYNIVTLTFIKLKTKFLGSLMNRIGKLKSYIFIIPVAQKILYLNAF